MKRRELSRYLIAAAGAGGAAALPRAAQAATCTLPCYPRTASEVSAGVTPTDTSFPFGHVQRYGMVEGANIATNVNTLIFNSMMAVAAFNKGMDVFFPIGTWCGNFLVNTDNVTIIGGGGVGEIDETTCLRPAATGGGNTSTLRFGNNGTHFNEKCGIRHLVISGRRVGNTPGMATIALSLDGGLSHFHGHDFELVDGERSLDIDTATMAITCCYFTQWHIRNGAFGASQRAISIRRRPGDGPYVTAIYFSQGHVNGPPDGYWLQANGTDSPGVTISMQQVYVDHPPGHGALLIGGCQIVGADLHLDPGAVGVPIIKREGPDSADPNYVDYNPGNTLFGTVQHGGQQIEFRNGQKTTIPDELNTFAKKAWFGELFLSQPLRFTNITSGRSVFDEDNVLPYLDTQTAYGPVRIGRSSFAIRDAGHGLRVAEGANAKQGVVTLSSGAAVVSNTSVTANSRIFLTGQKDGGSPGFLRVSTRVPGASFTIASSNPNDFSTVAYEIFEPA